MAAESGDSWLSSSENAAGSGRGRVPNGTDAPDWLYARQPAGFKISSLTQRGVALEPALPVIRQAEPSDALPLAELAELTFRHTFEVANTPEDMRLHCAAHYSEAIQAREISDPQITTLVSEHDGQLVGFAQLRWGRPPDCIKAERPAEIQRPYVREAWHGKGVAPDLMSAAIALAKASHADQVWLGVWEHNPRAIAFYRKWGFAEAGEHVFPVGTDPQRDVIMSRVIGPG